jgi:anti-anti-sigma factor
VSDLHRIPAKRRAVLVTMPAVIDAASSDHIGRELVTALASGAPTVIADLTYTRSCDCAGLRMLFAALAKAAEQGTDLRLVVPPAGVVQQTLENSGLDGLLPAHPTLRSARPPGSAPVPFPPRSPSSAPEPV